MVRVYIKHYKLVKHSCFLTCMIGIIIIFIVKTIL